LKAYRYVAQPQFWRNFKKLPRQQWVSIRRVWQIFKRDPFDPRLGTHKIHTLSAIFGRTVYAVVVEGDLRITFYIDGDTVVTTNVGTHSIYRS
jgi:mRNA-degrading endonuclease YafQ of YafQ-DinJ toxin-antitoxin module